MPMMTLMTGVQVLAVLKNERMKDHERKKETEALLGGLAEERFAVLVNLGKKITDFALDAKLHSRSDELDENHGVNVQFEDSDEEDDDAFNDMNDDQVLG